MPDSSAAISSPRSAASAELEERFRRDSLVVSLARPEEYPEVEAVARAADPAELFEPLSAPMLPWFLDENPAGPGFLVIARAATDGPIVGHFLFYASPLLHTDGRPPRELPAYLYVHLYVSPSYRRRGVFAAMFAFGTEVLKRMGVPFAYTVPNPRSSPGFVKFGVPLLGSLPVRMAPALPVWHFLGRLTAPGGADVAAERVDGFDDEMVAATRRRMASVVGVRSVAGLDWRFRQRPGARYAIWKVLRGADPAGYLVTRIVQIRKFRVLAICDLAIDPLDAAVTAAVLRRVCRDVAAEHPDLVMFQGGPVTVAARLSLARAGLVKVPAPFLPQPVAVFGGAPGQRGSTPLLPPLDRWYLTPADWDVF